MTLVAAIRVDGIPLLISDVLITRTSGGGVHRSVPAPNRDEVSQHFPEEWGTVIDPPRQKVRRISRTLVVAYAGNNVAGEATIRGLVNAFSNAEPSTKQVEWVLARRPRSDPFHEVVGWIFSGSKHRCFRWTNTSGKMSYESPAIAGSGKQRILDWLNRLPDTKMNSLKDPAFVGANVVGQFWGEDFRHLEGLNTACGGGWQVVFWDGTDFTHLSDIAFLNIKIERVDGNVQVSPGARVVKCEFCKTSGEQRFFVHKTESKALAFVPPRYELRTTKDPLERFVLPDVFGPGSGDISPESTSLRASKYSLYLYVVEPGPRFPYELRSFQVLSIPANNRRTVYAAQTLIDERIAIDATMLEPCIRQILPPWWSDSSVSPRSGPL